LSAIVVGEHNHLPYICDAIDTWEASLKPIGPRGTALMIGCPNIHRPRWMTTGLVILLLRASWDAHRSYVGGENRAHQTRAKKSFLSMETTHVFYPPLLGRPSRRNEQKQLAGPAGVKLGMKTQRLFPIPNTSTNVMGRNKGPYHCQIRRPLGCPERWAVRVKKGAGRFPGEVQPHPATAPAGGNRSSHGKVTKFLLEGPSIERCHDIGDSARCGQALTE